MTDTSTYRGAIIAINPVPPPNACSCRRGAEGAPCIESAVGGGLCVYCLTWHTSDE